MNFSSLTPNERRAVADAADALRTVVRLSELQLREGSLTANQERDFTAAVRTYNAAGAAIPELPAMTGGWDEKDLDRAVRSVENLSKLVEMDAKSKDLRAKVHAVIGDPHAADVKPADPIRDMLESHERQADFDWPTDDQLRQFPFGGVDETRTTTDFGMGSSLYTNDFATKVAVYLRTLSPWYGLATTITADNGRPMVVPKLTGDPTTYTPGEGTAITASDATLANVTVTPTAYKALAYTSYEALEDTEVNLTNYFAASQARAISLAFGTDATTAVLAGINNGGTALAVGGYGTATGTFLGWEDLIDLELGRAAPYRPNGVFVMANGAIKKARKFRDGQGQYLWTPGLGAQPNGIAGHTVYEDPNLAAPASATKSVVFGDMAAALIVKASPIRVAVSSEFKFDLDVIALKTVHRIALAVQDPAAAAFLVSANA